MTGYGAKIAIGIAAGILAVAVGAEPAAAKRLAVSGNLEAHVPDGGWCAETVYLEVRSPDQLVFSGDMLAVQRLLNVARYGLAAECPQTRNLRIVGTVGGVVVYTGAVAPNGAIASDPAPNPDARLPIERADQVREVQAALTALGFSPGPVDGLMGSQTFRAITEFQLSRGLPADGEVDLALIEQLRAAQGRPVPAPPQVAGTAPGAFNSPGNSPGVGGGAAGSGGQPVLAFPDQGQPVLAFPDGAAAAEPLAGFPAFERLLADYVAATPSLADRERFVVGYMAMIDGCQELATLLGNEIELPRYIAQNRQRVLDAMAQAPHPPFTLRFTTNGELANYDHNRGGLPLALDSLRTRVSGGSVCRDGAIGTSALRRYVGGDFPSEFHINFDRSAMPGLVPMSTDQASAFISSREQGPRMRSVDVEVIVGNIALDPQVSTVGEPVFVGELITLTIRDPQDGTELLRIDGQDAQGGAAGVPVSGEAWARLVAYADQNQMRVVNNRLLAYVSGREEQPGFDRLLRIAALQGLTADDMAAAEFDVWTIAAAFFPADVRRELVYAALGTLSESQIQTLNRRDWMPNPSDFNEFERPRLSAAFDSYLPELYASFPPIQGMPLLLACGVRIGSYDYATGEFPVASDCGDQLGRSSGFGWLGMIPEISGLPDRLPVPRDQAEQFVATLGSDRVAAFGIETRITGFSPNADRDGAWMADVSVEGVALYRDLTFTAETYRWDLASLQREAEAAEAIAAAVPPIDQAAPTAPLYLDMEAVRLLLIRAGRVTTEDASTREWLVNFAAAEAQGTSGWTRFLSEREMRALAARRYANDPVDPATLERFAQWNAFRAQALPETLLLRTWSAETAEVLDHLAQFGQVPAFGSESADFDHEVYSALGSRFAVTADMVHGMSGDEAFGSWDLPDLALILPADVDAFQIEVGAEALARAGTLRAAVELRIGAVDLVRTQRNDQIVFVQATPAAARLTAGDGSLLAAGELLYDVPAGLEPVPAPPATYFYDSLARLGSADPVDLAMSLAPTQDAFEARDWATALIAAAEANRAAFDLDDPIWMIGEAELDQYNFALGVFPIKKLTLGPMLAPGETWSDLLEEVRFSLINAPSELAMDSDDAARAWQQASPSFPTFAIRYRVVPVGMEPRGGHQGPLLKLRLLGFELVDQDAVLAVRDPDTVRYAWQAEVPVPAIAAADPALRSLASEPGAFDILGARTGADLLATRDALVQSIQRPGHYLMAPHAQGIDDDALFRAGTLVVAEDRSDAVVLFSEPPQVPDRVTALSRHANFPDDARPSLDDIRSALVAKYGEPEEVFQDSYYQDWFALAWRETGGNESLALFQQQAEEARCRRQAADTFALLKETLSYLTGSTLYHPDEPWVAVLDDARLDLRQGQAAPFSTDLLRDLTQGRGDCGDELYAIVHVQDGGVEDLVLFTYSTRVLNAVDAARRAPLAPPPGPQPANPATSDEQIGSEGAATPGLRL